MKAAGIKIRLPVLIGDLSEALGRAGQTLTSQVRLKGLLAWLAWTAVVLGGTGVMAALAGGVYFYRPLPAGETSLPELARSNLKIDAATRRELARLQSETSRYRRGLEALKPRGIYIVIDTAHNRLNVMQGERVLHQAVCSSGSGLLLRDPDGNRQWVFDTPRGLFQVLRKMEDPVWKKPDWAFIEEGKPIPSDPSERFDPDSLGEYALYFGSGYMIHGTLYQRYLGASVTHGCVRLGDRDLERVFKLTPPGAPIYIF